jgi:hypothetical protein
VPVYRLFRARRTVACAFFVGDVAAVQGAEAMLRENGVDQLSRP